MAHLLEHLLLADEIQPLTSDNAKGKRGEISRTTHAKVVEELDLTVSKFAKMKAVLARNGIAFNEFADDQQATTTLILSKRSRARYRAARTRGHRRSRPYNKCNRTRRNTTSNSNN